MHLTQTNWKGIIKAVTNYQTTSTMNTPTKGFKQLFSSWDIGEKIVFIASCIAFISFFLPWVDIGLASSNGFSQGGILLFALYIYPLFKLFKKKPISKLISISSSILVLLIMFAYIKSKTLDWFGETINVSSTGAHLFIIASIGWLIGSILSKNKGEAKVLFSTAKKHWKIFTATGVILLMLITGITITYKHANTPSSQKDPEKLASTNEVTLEISKKGFYEEGFQDQITFSLVFTNTTNKDIHGVQGILTFYDIFGNSISSQNIAYDQGIEANSYTTWEAGLSYNPYIDSDVKLKDTTLENLEYNWEITDVIYSDTNTGESTTATSNTSTGNKVSLEVLDKGFQTVSYMDYITFKFNFTNNTEQNINGVEGAIIFYDIFGNKLYTVTVAYDQGIEALSSTEWDASMDYNQFIDEDVKLNSTDLSNLNYTWDISTIVYEDGTKEEL